MVTIEKWIAGWHGGMKEACYVIVNYKVLVCESLAFTKYLLFVHVSLQICPALLHLWVLVPAVGHP